MWHLVPSIYYMMEKMYISDSLYPGCRVTTFALIGCYKWTKQQQSTHCPHKTNKKLSIMANVKRASQDNAGNSVNSICVLNYAFSIRRNVWNLDLTKGRTSCTPCREFKNSSNLSNSRSLGSSYQLSMGIPLSI